MNTDATSGAGFVIDASPDASIVPNDVAVPARSTTHASYRPSTAGSSGTSPLTLTANVAPATTGVPVGSSPPPHAESASRPASDRLHIKALIDPVPRPRFPRAVCYDH